MYVWLVVGLLLRRLLLGPVVVPAAGGPVLPALRPVRRFDSWASRHFDPPSQR